MAYTIKPASPALQTGDEFYSLFTSLWLFQGNGNDIYGVNNMTLSDPNPQSITWPTDGDDGQVVDRNTDNNTDRYTLAGIARGTKFSVAGRCYSRSGVGYSTVLGTATDGIFLRKSGAENKYHYEFYNALYSAIPGPAWSVYSNFVFTYDVAATPKWKWWVNGVNDASGTDTIAAATFVNCLSDGSSNEMDGRIAWLGIALNHVFTSTQVGTLNTDYYRLVTPAASGGGAGKGGGAKVGGKGPAGGGGRRQIELGGASCYPFWGGF